ncbi:non-structural maintenance of chromosomes element 3 homolog [Calliopsis andreniformis]|uniref:non-structural maintenance of chromosomes element 3 homolog n=1 Tax=Calliopsis andreniformis TaxID=337506 RepID=UPI003FCC5561
MGSQRDKLHLLEEKSLSQSRVRRKSSNVISLSQPVPSTSSHRRLNNQQQDSNDRSISEDQSQLVNSVIRYLFLLDKRKQVINKIRIIKNAFGGQGKHFQFIMKRTGDLLSKIFGYRLVELENTKYMLVNEIDNTFPHLYPLRGEGCQQVLLFIVLTHIFMHEESCSEELLWDFLTNLGIECSENRHDSYFGNVKHLISEVFVNQGYINKTVVEQNDLSKVEFKWGPRANHEFSRRKSLEFVSQVYNGRPINSWPLQFKALAAWNK